MTTSDYLTQIQTMICKNNFLYIFMVFIAGDVFCFERLFGKRFMTHDLWLVQLIDFYILHQRTWPSMLYLGFIGNSAPLSLFDTDNTAPPNLDIYSSESFWTWFSWNSDFRNFQDFFEHSRCILNPFWKLVHISNS